MGFGNLVKNVAGKTTSLVKNEIDKKNEAKQFQQRLMTLPKVSLNILSNAQSVHAAYVSTMYQNEDGTVFFYPNKDDSFTIIDYFWNGSQYDTVSQGTNITNAHEQTKGKSGKIIAGAAIGALAGPAGMVVGAAAGAGGKTKKHMNSVSNTNTVTRQIEVKTPATLKFRNNNTGEIVGISFQCDSVIDSKIRCFHIEKEVDEPKRSIVEHVSKNQLNPYEELKSLKELLDAGIISQEEFDRKKSDILGV